MKKYLSILLSLPAIAVAQSPNFTLTGKLPVSHLQELVYLSYSAGTKTVTDSTAIVDGAFHFSGYISRRAIGTLSLHAPGKPIRVLPAKLYIEPGIIEVKSPDSLAHVGITGTPMNNAFQDLRVKLQRLDSAMTVIQQQFATLTTDDEKRVFLAQSTHKQAEIYLGKNVEMKKFVLAHPASEASIDVLRSWAGPIPDYIRTDSLFLTLSPAVRHTADGEKMAATLAKLKLTAVGSPAPEFSEPDTSGKSIALSSMRGRYVLLDFWASWCVPCRAEFPAVVATYQKYKNKNFEILGVSLDDVKSRKAWVNAIKTDHLAWTNISELHGLTDGAAVLYDVNAVPQNFLIDPNGIIIAKNLHGARLEQKLAELFGKPTTN